ncbi:hypothetical protein MMC31_004021 [Peltigera leucophlebia]|nr:hypothetical protein [Peltigera leucophlebia]
MLYFQSLFHSAVALLSAISQLSSTTAFTFPDKSPSTNFIGRTLSSREITSAFGVEYFGNLAERSANPLPKKRVTTAACALSAGSPQYDDAIAAINALAALALRTQCVTKKGCTEVQQANSAHIGLCGPYTYSQSCASLMAYFRGITNTCHKGSVEREWGL